MQMLLISGFYVANQKLQDVIFPLVYKDLFSTTNHLIVIVNLIVQFNT